MDYGPSYILAATSVLSLAACLLTWAARKDRDIMRSEFKADLVTLELRLTNEIRLQKQPQDIERLVRIEERMQALSLSVTLHNDAMQAQLSTMAKIRQGCEDCLLKSRAGD